ncbi:hypothetical protein CYMTET_10007 [Cymbomonas tetramitiformis]|uniref:Uncharacterized protein n=1 Tax=Cymbomonas tetramitiformis TaxID=36881 RepID=A0AAE0GQ47_9CHLO|nr:hypothetical protein CYMTET_10007 [Cymbomonas tetramitiformis]
MLTTFCNRTITFLGDSISRQAASSFMCVLEAHLVGGGLSEPVTRATCHTFSSQVGPDASPPGQPVCALTVCFDTITATDEPVRLDVISTVLLKTAQLERGGVVILNFGLHYHNQQSYVRDLIATVATLRRLHQSLGANSSSLKVLWREITPQHFPKSPGGQFSPKAYKNAIKVGCKKNEPYDTSTAIGPNWRNVLASKYMSSAGVEILPIFEELRVHGEDMHVGSQNRGVVRRVTGKQAKKKLKAPKHIFDEFTHGDCSHYCQPGLIDLATIELLYTTMSK